MKIAVALGGISPERNISFLSGRSITNALRERGHTVIPVDPALGANPIVSDEDLEAASNARVTPEELQQFKKSALLEFAQSEVLADVDIVFLALHGAYGEDGYIQGLLDLRGIPYTGSNMAASSVAMDKTLTKMLMQVGGIPTPYWVGAQPEFVNDSGAIEEIQREINGPMVIKTNDGGSTVGLTIAHTGSFDEVVEGISKASEYSSNILIERYIRGRELTVAVLGSDALPVVEIVPNEGYYDYENKYTKGKTEYHCPADITEEVRDHIMNLAVTAHHVVGCSVFSRVDFILNEDNIPVCLEVNTIPGFTELSLVPIAAKEIGLEFGPLCEEIIRLSLESTTANPDT